MNARLPAMKLKFILPGVFTVFCLVALGWWLRAPSTARAPEPPDSDVSSLQRQISQLKMELAAEKTRNTELQRQFQAEPPNAAVIESELGQTADSDITEATPDSRDDGNSDFSSQPRNDQDPSSRTSIPAVDELTEAGIPPAIADAIREIIGQNRLSMLTLSDRAGREGWLKTQRYVQEVHKLTSPRQQIREQFGDDIYDRYLYAIGSTNRVAAVEVYPDSAAAVTGIMPSDIVLSYGGKNIYSMQDLRHETMAGTPGESVLVTLKRDNSVFSITVPRGPLGIEMRMQSEAPE